MYEHFVNQNLNYVYTRAQSPTAMRDHQHRYYDPQESIVLGRAVLETALQRALYWPP